MRRDLNLPIVLASVALGASTLLFGAAVVRAVTVDPAEDVEPVPVDVEVAAAASAPEPASAAAAGVEEDRAHLRPEEDRSLRGAVDADPFSPDRRPPAMRYRLPGERVPMARGPEPEPEAPEPPEFRVVGAAVIGEGGAALIQVDDGRPRLLSVGESLMGYTLDSVNGESATLIGEAGTLQFPVTMADFDRRSDDRRDRRRRGDDDERRRAQQIEQQRLERMRSIMLRVQAAQQQGGRLPGGGP